jgi:hypothetical protein
VFACAQLLKSGYKVAVDRDRRFVAPRGDRLVLFFGPGLRQSNG